MKRRLSLKSETLTELSHDDLRAVAGAAGVISQNSCPLDESVRICSLRCQTTFNTCAGS